MKQQVDQTVQFWSTQYVYLRNTHFTKLAMTKLTVERLYLVQMYVIPNLKHIFIMKP